MYQLIALVHVLAVLTWVGGILFLSAVLVPVTRRLNAPPGAGPIVLRAAAQRFRAVGWGALAVLVITGIVLLLERDVSVSRVLQGDGPFYQTLRIKLVLVAAVLVLSAVHDFLLGPRLARRLTASSGPASSPELQRARARVSWIARLNALLALAIVVAGVFLVRGVPW